jgi:Pentapeptide repeats (8 copies)
MSKTKRLSIPKKLQEIKAYQIHQKKIWQDHETNWNEAEEYFIANPNKILEWHFRNNLLKLCRSFKYFLIICGRALFFPCYLSSQLFALFKLIDSRSFALDIIKTIISIIGLILSLIGLILSCIVVNINHETMFFNLFLRALDQLNSNEEHVKSSGINILTRLASQFPNHRLEILENLSYFIQKSSPNRLLNNKKYQSKSEIYDIFTWDYKSLFNGMKPLPQSRNESSTWLIQSTVQLFGEINGDKAYIKKSLISMKESNLTNIDFSGRNYLGVNFSHSDMTGANMTGANMTGAIMINAIYTNSQIKKSCNWEKVQYKNSPNSNLEMINRLKQEKASDPKKPIDCSEWK